MIRPREEHKVDKLKVLVFETEEEMGYYDAVLISEKIKELQKIQDEVNIVFAPAVSQLSVYKYLFDFPGVDWSKVNGFHLDEYIGLANDDERKITNFARKNIFSKANFKNLFLMDSLKDSQEVIAEYTKFLEEHPLDIAVIGIGTNGHIAYNEPSNADFNDPEVIKIVDIDETSIKQASEYDQIFASKEDVIGTKAYTMTIPTIMKAKYLFLACPREHKQKAVYECLTKEVCEKYPASILRKHDNTMLLLDAASAHEWLVKQ